jgi:hypothetical protein
MLLTTPQELRQYLPTHVIESLEPLYGFIDNSEHDFLLEKIGKPLYAELTKVYDELIDKDETLPGGNNQTPWMQLIHLCQRPVAFDMLYRAADVSAVSVNESGLNVIDSDGYDNADEKTIDRYKKRLNQEAHRGIDRLLYTLEEWAEELSQEEQSEDTEEKQTIIDLWRKSRYFYLAEGLFINTARKFNEFIDFYESREKFIQLLPDLRYCQEFVLRPEIGDALTDNLMGKMQNGELTEIEGKAVRLAQYALALKVEARSKLFNRPEAKDEAIGAMTRLVDYLKANQSDLDAEAVKTSPFYEAPKAEVKPTDPERPVDPWKNNRKGNKLFVARAIE